MAKVITFAINKGGTAKTTSAVSLSAALRGRGLDVLLIDIDGQCNATKFLRGKMVHTPVTSYDVLAGFIDAAAVDPCRLYERDNGTGVLDLLPSHADISALERLQDPKTGKAIQNATISTRLHKLVQALGKNYDVILIDTPPNMGPIVIASLYAADQLIMTAQAEYGSLEGIARMDQLLQSVNSARANGPLPAKVLITMYDKRKGLHRAIADKIRAEGLDTCRTEIRNNVTLAEAALAGLDVFDYAPSSNGAKDYQSVADELISQLNLIKKIVLHSST